VASPPELTPEQRKLRARIAGHASWKNTADRTERTRAGHEASPQSFAYWRREVDPDGVMDPDERDRRASPAYREHMARLAFKSSKARAAKKRGAA
jgi:hypothetical protein